MLQYLKLLQAVRAFAYRCVGKSKLSKEQRNTLELMHQDNSISGSPFVASALWQAISRQFDHLFRLEGINHVESQFYNNLFSQPDPTSPRNYRYALWMLYCHVRQRDKWNFLKCLSATASHDSETVIVFEGKAVSWDLLISLNTLYSIAEIDGRIFTEPIVVADLGAGWGRLAYVLKKINPACTCLIFDLPEPLLISMSYLPQLLPGEGCHFYEETREMSSISRKDIMQKSGIWFCGTQDLPRFENKAIDVFINVASFQEMTKQQISSYFEIIDAKVNGLLYLQQYWKYPAYKDKFNLVSGYEDYPFLPHWKEICKRDITFSDLYFEAIFAVGD